MLSCVRRRQCPLRQLNSCDPCSNLRGAAGTASPSTQSWLFLEISPRTSPG